MDQEAQHHHLSAEHSMVLLADVLARKRPKWGRRGVWALASTEDGMATGAFCTQEFFSPPFERLILRDPGLRHHAH